MLFEELWRGVSPTCKVPWGLGPQKLEMEETYKISSSCSFPRQYKSVPHGTFSSAVSRLILFLNDSYDRVSSSSTGDWMAARTFFFFFSPYFDFVSLDSSTILRSAICTEH